MGSTDSSAGKAKNSRSHPKATKLTQGTRREGAKLW